MSGVASFYARWGQYNGRLVHAIRGLSDEQLKLRVASGKWPIWAIAAHIAGGRVYWLCGVFKESGAEDTPFTDPLSGVGWEDDESVPRGSNELVFALESSWRLTSDRRSDGPPSCSGKNSRPRTAGRTNGHRGKPCLIGLLSTMPFTPAPTPS